jgi:hypothetical protein
VDEPPEAGIAPEEGFHKRRRFQQQTMLSQLQNASKTLPRLGLLIGICVFTAPPVY